MTPELTPDIAYSALLPLLVVFGAAIIGVLVEAFAPARRRYVVQMVIYLGGLAAAFAAVTLIRWSRGRTSPLWLTMAVVVGASRAVVRIHHASDVVGGAVTGAALARLLARPLDRLAGRR